MNRISDNPKNIVAETKINIALLPAAGVIHGARACMDGASRYGPYNWRDKEIALLAYASAAMRHIQSFIDGEDIDPSGCHHLGHAIAGLAIALDAIESGTAIDDRPKPGPAPALLRRLADQLKQRHASAHGQSQQETNAA